jgi:hypothetical protein
MLVPFASNMIFPHERHSSGATMVSAAQLSFFFIFIFLLLYLPANIAFQSILAEKDMLRYIAAVAEHPTHWYIYTNVSQVHSVDYSVANRAIDPGVGYKTHVDSIWLMLTLFIQGFGLEEILNDRKTPWLYISLRLH